MTFLAVDEVRYFAFGSLQEAGIVHGAITRHGGVSPSPWSSLNVGGTVGDEISRVRENRHRTFRAFNRSMESLYDVWQVHSNQVVCANSPRLLNTPHLQADAILTDHPGITLFMRFADCVPIFLYDPMKKVIGLVHAGWKGTVLQILAEAIRTMRERYHSNPVDVLAGIGPSIGPDHYTIGEDVIQQVVSAFGEEASGLLSTSNDGTPGATVKLDLWNANRLVLERAGVRKIEIAGLCTACNTSDWYSHRGEAGQTGRFGALIGL
jgi:hypothetical protein